MSWNVLKWMSRWLLLWDTDRHLPLSEESSEVCQAVFCSFSSLQMWIFCHLGLTALGTWVLQDVLYFFFLVRFCSKNLNRRLYLVHVKIWGTSLLLCSSIRLNPVHLYWFGWTHLWVSGWTHTEKVRGWGRRLCSTRWQLSSRRRLERSGKICKNL